MQINPKIKETIKSAGLNESNILAYLLALHFNVKASYVPISVIKDSLSLNVFTFGDSEVIWSVPLFEEEQNKKVDSFDWVAKEYVPLFKGKEVNKREATARMKKLFATNPDIRKDEVIEATENYIDNTDLRYIKQPHYFIEKGIGAAKTQDILHWIDVLRDNKESQEFERDDTRRFQ